MFGRRDSLNRRIYYSRLKSIPPLDALLSFRRKPPTDLNILRAMRAAIVWRGNSWRESFDQAAKYGLWLTFPFRAIDPIRRFGGAAKAEYRRGYARQALDIARLALVNGLTPKDYYEGGLAGRHGAPELARFIPFDLYASVAFGLSAFRDRGSLALELDKFAFERECRRRGLPSVETLAIVDREGAKSPDGVPLPELPPEDLILKPSRGSQGRGVALWRWDGSGAYTDRRGRSLSSAALVEEVQARARRAKFPYLFQRRALNGPELRDLAGPALSTLRVVTVIDETGQPEIVDAFYRTAVAPDAAADNYHSGGTWFPVDFRTGILQAGFHYGFERHPVRERFHPITGAPVAGRLHPGAAASFDLARRAHRAFPDLLVVGWDIGYGPDGPVIVEFNVPPGTDAGTQNVYGGFIGSRFGDLFAFHAARWLEANVPAGSRWSFARPPATAAAPAKPAIPAESGAALPVNRL